MTSRTDRRSRIRQYPLPVVQRAIDDIIYNPTDRQMIRDMFVGDMTYREAEEVYNYSRTGMNKHVGAITNRLETYLQKGKLN